MAVDVVREFLTKNDNLINPSWVKMTCGIITHMMEAKHGKN